MKQRIINITLTDLGGAGIAAKRTHEFMLKAGYDSHLIVYTGGNSPVPNILKVPKNSHLPTERTLTEKIKDKLQFYKDKINPPKKLSAGEKEDLYKTREHYCYYTLKETQRLNIDFLLDYIKDGDTVIVYWIAENLNTGNLKELFNKRKIKLFWYAVDYAAVTGGCHFPWECKGYLSNCMPCPANKPYGDQDLSRKQMTIKKRNLSDLPISIISSSQYGIHKFQQSSLKYSAYYKLTYAIDPEVFSPPFQVALDDKKIFNVFFNAFNEKDERKGSDLFENIIEALSKKIISAGSDIKINLVTVNYEYHKKLTGKAVTVESFEKTKTDSELAKLYQVSDLFICTSTEDLCPLMVNEALLCGLPVFAFDVAANTEYIKHGINGFIIPPFNTELFATTVFNYLRDPGIITTDKAEIHRSILPFHDFNEWKATFKKIIGN